MGHKSSKGISSETASPKCRATSPRNNRVLAIEKLTLVQSDGDKVNNIVQKTTTMNNFEVSVGRSSEIDHLLHSECLTKMMQQKKDAKHVKDVPQCITIATTNQVQSPVQRSFWSVCVCAAARFFTTCFWILGISMHFGMNNNFNMHQLASRAPQRSSRCAPHSNMSWFMRWCPRWKWHGQHVKQL